MKNCFFVAIFSVCFLAGAHASDCHAVEGASCKKLYIAKRNVEVLKSGFRIFTKKRMILARTIRSDEKGLYILEEDICCEKWREPPIRHVFCETCGKYFETLREAAKHVADSGHKRFCIVR